MSNNSGVHGQGQILFGNGSFIQLETGCVKVDGNEAVYGGLVDGYLGNFDCGGCLDGANFYIKVIDNGQGANADPDQYSDLLGISPDFPLDYCDFVTTDVAIPGSLLIPPGDDITWDDFGAGMNDVVNGSDNIVVK